MIAKLITALPLLAVAVAAQQPRPTLASLRQQFDDSRRELVRRGSGAEERRKLTEGLARRLQEFLRADARGLDVYNGRLMLANVYRNLDRAAEAKRVLLALDAAQAPGPIVLAAARLAGELGMAAQRRGWIDLAVGKKTTLEDRMTMVMQLVTVLGEIETADHLVVECLKVARDDEQRAEIAWFVAQANREREDLEADAYGKVLAELAKRYPRTRYGGIAADQLRAREFKLGSAAVPLSLIDTEGRPVRLADYHGKVLLLDFWASWCGPCKTIAPALVTLHRQYGPQGFSILGISLDDDRAAMQAAVRDEKLPGRQVFGGQGWKTAAVLRYNVQALPHLLLLDRDGRIAALNLFPADPASTRELAKVIEAALQRPARGTVDK